MIDDGKNGGFTEFLDIPYARVSGAGFYRSYYFCFNYQPWDSWLHTYQDFSRWRLAEKLNMKLRRVMKFLNCDSLGRTAFRSLSFYFCVCTFHVHVRTYQYRCQTMMGYFIRAYLKSGKLHCSSRYGRATQLE